MKFSRKASVLASSSGDEAIVGIGTGVSVGVGEGIGTGVAVGVANGSGVAVGVGVGKGMLDAATAPETGVGVAMLDTAMEPDARPGIAVAVGVGDGNVRKTGVPSVSWGPSWLVEQANEPVIKTSRMEMGVYFLKGSCLSALAACWKCSIGTDEIKGLGLYIVVVLALLMVVAAAVAGGQ